MYLDYKSIRVKLKRVNILRQPVRNKMSSTPLTSITQLQISTKNSGNLLSMLYLGFIIRNPHFMRLMKGNGIPVITSKYGRRFYGPC